MQTASPDPSLIASGKRRRWKGVKDRRQGRWRERNEDGREGEKGRGGEGETDSKSHRLQEKRLFVEQD